MSCFMLRPSCRGISSQNPCSEGRLIAALHWAVASWLLWCLPYRPGLCQPGFVFQVTAAGSREMRPLQHLLLHHLVFAFALEVFCQVLQWPSQCHYFSQNSAPPFNMSFHEEQLCASFNTSWIPLRIALLYNNVCFVTSYKASPV